MKETKMVLTDEMRAKLKGVLGFQVDTEFKYVPKAWRDNPEIFPKKTWPVFRLRSLDSFDLAEVEDGKIERVTEGGKDTFKITAIARSGRTRIETLKKGILGWEKYPDENGNYIPFEGSDSIRHLKPELCIELQDAINERSTLTKEELQGLG